MPSLTYEKRQVGSSYMEISRLCAYKVVTWLHLPETDLPRLQQLQV